MYTLITGTPNKPIITGITFSEMKKRIVTVTWKITSHELRPIQRYIISVKITGSKTQVSNSSGNDGQTGGNGQTNGGDDSRVEIRGFNTTVNATDANCKLDSMDDNNCKHNVTLPEKDEPGETMTYDIILCAENEFGMSCGESKIIEPTSGPLQDPTGPSPGIIVGIVFAVLVAVLLCCLLWILLILLCCCFCVGGGREKKYHPEQRGSCNVHNLYHS